MRSRLFLVFLCSLLASACSKRVDPDEISPPLSSYYPQRTGLVRTYAVTDSTYTTSGGFQKTYRLRETHTGTQTDQLGRLLTTVRRDTNVAGSTTQYAMQTTWWQYIDQGYAERQEGNIRRLVLAYPIRRGLVWNGNQYNTENTELFGQLGTARFQFSYLHTDTTLTVQGRTYTNCILIQQRRVVGFLQYVIHTYEAYAPGVGMVLHHDSFTQNNILPGGVLQRNTNSYYHREELLPE